MNLLWALQDLAYIMRSVNCIAVHSICNSIVWYSIVAQATIITEIAVQILVQNAVTLVKRTVWARVSCYHSQASSILNVYFGN